MIPGVDILNSGAGDIAIRFREDEGEEGDPRNVIVMEDDAAVVLLTDLASKGYAILVRLPDGSYARARAIDRERRAYLVAMRPVGAALPPAVRVEPVIEELPAQAALPPKAPPPAAETGIRTPHPEAAPGAPWGFKADGTARKSPGRTGHRGPYNPRVPLTAVPIGETRATAVARTAGG